jgi:hypothetical protein
VNKLIALLLAGALAVGILYWRSSRWSPVGDDSFQVMMKGTVGGPDTDHQREQFGSVQTRQWHSQPFFGGETFMAMTLDLEGVSPTYDNAAGLKSIAAGIAQRANGSLKGETPIEVAGMPGMQFDVEIRPTGRILLRGFSRDRRIYLMAFKWRDQGAPPRDAAKFFDSFAIR